jgi:hypothetical protein
MPGLLMVEPPRGRHRPRRRAERLLCRRSRRRWLGDFGSERSKEIVLPRVPQLLLKALERHLRQVLLVHRPPRAPLENRLPRRFHPHQPPSPCLPATAVAQKHHTINSAPGRVFNLICSSTKLISVFFIASPADVSGKSLEETSEQVRNIGGSINSGSANAPG